MSDKSIWEDIENYIKNFVYKDTAALLDVTDMIKKEQVIAVHTNKISQLNGSDKRWHTYVKIAGKNKEIKAPTEKALIEKLAEFYGIGDMTFQKLYAEWLEYKKTVTQCSATIRRHEQQFTKYFVKPQSKLLNMQITKIKRLTLQSECNQIVKTFCLSYKEWQNVKTIIKGMFDYALDKGLIKENPVDRLKITVKYRQVNKKPAELEIYSQEQCANMTAYFNEQYAKTGNQAYLAAQFQLYTGLRVGELIALRWEDVNTSGKTLHIVREVVSEPYKDESGKWHENRVIADHTKTRSDRFIQLLPQALALLGKLIKGIGYIFTRAGDHLTSRQVNYVYEKYAKWAGVSVKSSHKARKTYASTCYKAGISLEEIRKDLGHTNLFTTEKYIFMPEADQTAYTKKAAAMDFCSKL